MGYDITIGEARMQFPEASEAEEGVEPRIIAARTTHPDAPVFEGDGLTGNGNDRHPSYSGWSNFCGAAGLSDFFFDKSVGLMREHPGVAMLTQTHHARVLGALIGYRERNPGAVPGFGGSGDGTLARLVWLEWWVRWALANCKVPAMRNT